MKFILLVSLSFCFSLSNGHLRHLKKTKTKEVCPAIKCADPCTEYSPYLSQAKPKCSDNETCVTKPVFFRTGKLVCPGCDVFVKCKPKQKQSVDPLPCPMPMCMDPCADYDFATDLTTPKCPPSQKCITEMQYYDPKGLNCPMCLAFVRCE